MSFWKRNCIWIYRIIKGIIRICTLINYDCFRIIFIFGLGNIENNVEKVTTFYCVFSLFPSLILPSEQVDNLSGDVLEEGVEEVQHGGPEELRPEAEDERRQDRELGLRLPRFLLPVLVPDGDDV